MARITPKTMHIGSRKFAMANNAFSVHLLCERSNLRKKRKTLHVKKNWQ